MPDKNVKASLRLMSALVVRGAFDRTIVPAFEAVEDDRLAIEWSPTFVIMNRIAEGARADLVLVLTEAMDDLVAKDLVVPESRVDVAKSRFGLAVRAGTPHPRVDTVDALVRTLTQARSVAFSKTGASGIYFAKLMPILGIEDVVRSNATVIPEGFTAEKLVSGEADIAIQQISELMVVPGIEVVGPFPEAVQQETTFCAAVMRDAANPKAAARFVESLTNDRAVMAYRETGLEPITP